MPLKTQSPHDIILDSELGSPGDQGDKAFR